MEKDEGMICKILRKHKGLAYDLLIWLGTHEDEHICFQTTIAGRLGRKVSTVNYWITNFKEAGLIDEFISLTDKGRKLFVALWENENKKKLRAHNIQIKFKVEKCPEGFPDCFSNKIYQPLSNGRYRGLKTKLNGFTVMFYSPGKMVCVIPEIYADIEEEISGAIQLEITLLKSILEHEFEGVRLGDYELARIQTMHIAVLNSIIAEKHLIKGFTLENKDFAIDKSRGRAELELTNPKTALSRIDDLLDLEREERSKSLLKV